MFDGPLTFHRAGRTGNPQRVGGKALATIATPADPDETCWTRVCEIASQIVSERIGGTKLICQELPCAMAASATMSAADIVAD
jgi:hypothetical protein